jgi:hypothetical protein
MTIKATKGVRGAEMARCTCVECGKFEDVKASHGTCSRSSQHLELNLANQGQAVRKIEAQGWALVKNKLRCPSCEEKRREKVETPKEEALQKLTETDAELRQPTPKQKREIIGILEDVYDDDTKRYKGQETDKTVAEIIGRGVMPGWVAEIREEMFGPDGSNDEMESLLEEMKAWRDARMKDATNAKIHLESAEKVLREMDDAIKMVAEFEKRQLSIIKSVGPKAMRGKP